MPFLALAKRNLWNLLASKFVVLRFAPFCMWLKDPAAFVAELAAVVAVAGIFHGMFRAVSLARRLKSVNAPLIRCYSGPAGPVREQIASSGYPDA